MLRWVAVSAAVVAVVGTVPAPAAGAERLPSSAPRLAAPARIVTLGSGDRVAVQGDQVTILPGPGRDEVFFRQRRTKDGHIHVVPRDAVPLLRGGKVDKRLFDVTALLGEAGGGTDPLSPVGERVPEQRGDLYELTVTVVGRDGLPSDAEVGALDLESGESSDFEAPVGGVTRLRLAQGEYSVDALVHGDREHTWASTGKIRLERDTAITVDARQGKEIGARFDRAVGRKYVGIDAVYRAGGARVQTGVSTRSQDRLFAVPVKADAAYFNFGTFQVWGGGGHEYFVASPYEGGIPGVLAPRVRDRELYAEKARYRAQGVPAVGSRSSSPFYVKGQGVTFGVVFDLPIPSRRVEHFTGRADVKWVMDFFQRPLSQPSVGFDGHISAGRPVFVAGRIGSRSWNGVAASTDLNLRGFHGLVRFGNNGYVQHWPFAPGEADASDEFVFGGPYVFARTRMSTVEGEVITEREGVFANFSGLPEAPARYVLDVEASRSPKWTPFAPKVSARFEFVSGKTEGNVYLPVPTVRISGAFDDLNRAPAGCRVFGVDVNVVPQAGSVGAAAVKSVAVRASVDDGATWRTVPVVGAKARWKALVPHPVGAEFVSLNVKVVDAAGNSVEQTTMRAYGINRPLG
jgi:hypothetical protein